MSSHDAAYISAAGDERLLMRADTRQSTLPADGTWRPLRADGKRSLLQVDSERSSVQVAGEWSLTHVDGEWLLTRADGWRSDLQADGERSTSQADNLGANGERRTLHGDRKRSYSGSGGDWPRLRADSQHSTPRSVTMRSVARVGVKRSALRVGVKRSTLRSVTTRSAARVGAKRSVPTSGSVISARGEVAARAALRQLGIPFSWGGGSPTGPTRGVGRGARTTGFDCSGLTLYAWSQAGVKLPRHTGAQFRQGRRITLKDLRRGDLVFFGGGSGDPTHVGLYVGRGTMIHAPKTGDVVRKTPFLGSTYFRSTFRGAVRPS
ncbi:C40 family peptidase [Nonomuraea longicatena]|uniref:C40 family peptidase n=1 Tax=Nonomuraea longicatena TaxID=83682 RepID=UPI0031DEF4C7